MRQKGPRIIPGEKYIQHKGQKVKTIPDMVITWIRNSPNNIKVVSMGFLFPSLDSYGDTRSNKPDV